MVEVVPGSVPVAQVVVVVLIALAVTPIGRALRVVQVLLPEAEQEVEAHLRRYLLQPAAQVVVAAGLVVVEHPEQLVVLLVVEVVLLVLLSPEMLT